MTQRRTLALPVVLLTVLALCAAVPARAAAQEPPAPPAASSEAPATTDAAGTSDVADAQDAGAPAEAGEETDEGGIQLLQIPVPNLDAFEPAVSRQLAEVQGALSALLARLQGEGATPPTREELSDSYGVVGQHYQVYGLSEAAVACYRNAATLAPEDPRWPHLMGRALQDAGRLPEAAAAYQHALELSPQDVPALIYLAEVRSLQGQPQEASELYQRAVDADPDSPAALAGLGEAALDSGDAQRAAELLESALTLLPAADRLRYPLGLAYRALGDEDKAKENLTQAGTVGVRPQDPLLQGLEALRSGERAHLLRGHMAFRAGHYAEAANAYHRALDAQPNSVPALVDLASALSQLGYLEGAEERLRSALALQPDNANAHYNLGTVLLASGERAGAVVHLRRSLSLAPDDAAVRVALARALGPGDEDEVDEALQQYRRAIELGVRDDDVYLGLAELLLGRGRYAEAQQVLEDGFAALQSSVPLLHGLARLLAANPDPTQRDGERAFDLAERAYAAAATIPHAETLAMALAESGRCSEAADWQGKAQEVARKRGNSAYADAMNETLARYQAGPPCRPPVAETAAGGTVN